MVTKNLETVSGLVEQINAKRNGIKVAGQWLNISQYHPLAQLPEPGQRVDVQMERTERGLWINAVDVLDGGQVHPLPMQQRRVGRQYSDPHEIRRLAVLKAAAIFGASRPDMKSADVLTLADRWLNWAERPATPPSPEFGS